MRIQVFRWSHRLFCLCFVLFVASCGESTTRLFEWYESPDGGSDASVDSDFDADADADVDPCASGLDSFCEGDRLYRCGSDGVEVIIECDNGCVTDAEDSQRARCIEDEVPRCDDRHHEVCDGQILVECLADGLELETTCPQECSYHPPYMGMSGWAECVVRASCDEDHHSYCDGEVLHSCHPDGTSQTTRCEYLCEYFAPMTIDPLGFARCGGSGFCEELNRSVCDGDDVIHCFPMEVRHHCPNGCVYDPNGFAPSIGAASCL